MRASRFCVPPVILWLLLTTAIVFAQSEPGQWVGDLYLVETYPERQTTSRVSALVDENENISMKIPNISESAGLAIPSKYRRYSWHSCWHDSALYSVAYGDYEHDLDGTEFVRWTFAKWQDEEWHFLGDYKTDTRELLKFIPCEDGRFVVISARNDLSGNLGADRSPFARVSFHPGKKEMKVDSSIVHGQDELRQHMSNPEFFKLAWLSHIATTDKHATLVNPNTGLFWIFSLENASLVKAGNIFKKVTPEMVAKGGFTSPVLCMNPEKNGVVLISAEEEDFFLRETKNIYAEVNELYAMHPGLTDEEANELSLPFHQEHASNSPFVAWYRIYPETGKTEKLLEPPAGGSNLRKDGRVWRPMPDGSVKMNWGEWSLKDSKSGRATKPKTNNSAADESECEESSQCGGTGISATGPPSDRKPD